MRGMAKTKLPPTEELIALYKAGLSCKAIAESIGGCKPVSVHSRLVRAGVQMRSLKEASALALSTGRLKPKAHWSGKKQPAEMVEKRIAKIRGKKHYAYKDGLSVREYRGKVAKVVCESCAARTNLCIHHKDFDHYNNSESNLSVLCVSCHLSLHKARYWESLKSGDTPKSSNGPIGWKR